MSTLAVVSAQAGDFNGDLGVNGTDFLEWQRGNSPVPLSAADLSDWQTNYGAAANSTAAAVVPEPAAAALLGVGISLALAVRRKRNVTLPHASVVTQRSSGRVRVVSWIALLVASAQPVRAADYVVNTDTGEITQVGVGTISNLNGTAFTHELPGRPRQAVLLPRRFHTRARRHAHRHGRPSGVVCGG